MNADPQPHPGLARFLRGNRWLARTGYFPAEPPALSTHWLSTRTAPYSLAPLGRGLLPCEDVVGLEIERLDFRAVVFAAVQLEGGEVLIGVFW